MSKLMIYTTGFCLVFLVLLAILVLCGVLWAVYPRKSTMGRVTCSVVKHQGKDVLALDAANYSPTTAARIVNVTIDAEEHVVYLDKLKILWLPGSRRFIGNRFPIIVNPSAGQYTVKAWAQDKYLTIGYLTVRENHDMSFEETQPVTGQ